MNRSRAARGLSLIEVLVSLAILPIVMAGVFGAHIAATRAIGDGKKQAEATMLASELASVLTSMPYTTASNAPSGLFSNNTTTNDCDLTDMAGNIDSSSATDPVGSNIADHKESDLPTAVQSVLTPTNGTTVGGSSAMYERYWNIGPICDPISGSPSSCSSGGVGSCSGTVGGVNIAAIVRWPNVNGKGYNHVSVLTMRFDPSLFRE
jgi:prepilin-type N-terminal cleavage/methylation domain-containing protein